MTIVEQIEEQVRLLPLEKQMEVLNFAAFLHLKSEFSPVKQPKRPLQKHPAFGLWQSQPVNALAYEQLLRAEWE